MTEGHRSERSLVGRPLGHDARAPPHVAIRFRWRCRRRELLGGVAVIQAGGEAADSGHPAWRARLIQVSRCCSVPWWRTGAADPRASRRQYRGPVTWRAGQRPAPRGGVVNGNHLSRRRCPREHKREGPAEAVAGEVNLVVSPPRLQTDVAGFKPRWHGDSGRPWPAGGASAGIGQASGGWIGLS